MFHTRAEPAAEKKEVPIIYPSARPCPYSLVYPLLPSPSTFCHSQTTLFPCCGPPASCCHDWAVADQFFSTGLIVILAEFCCGGSNHFVLCVSLGLAPASCLDDALDPIPCLRQHNRYRNPKANAKASSMTNPQPALTITPTLNPPQQPLSAPFRWRHMAGQYMLAPGDPWSQPAKVYTPGQTPPPSLLAKA